MSVDRKIKRGFKEMFREFPNDHWPIEKNFVKGHEDRLHSVAEIKWLRKYLKKLLRRVEGV